MSRADPLRIADYLRQTLDMTELCQMFGISRKTGYKWIERYLRQGPQGLEDRSRRPEAIRIRHPRKSWKR